MKLIATIAVLLALTACSNRQVYNTLKGARHYECNQIRDTNKQESCMASANKSYNNYEAQRDR